MASLEKLRPNRLIDNLRAALLQAYQLKIIGTKLLIQQINNFSS